MPKITVDGIEYNTEDLSDNGKAQLASLQFLETQMKKFDKDLIYVKKWVPEYGTEEYPDPIVEHKEAYQRCLATYKEAV